ncbi:hypothetical protein H4R24_000401 [Coemansia sp. RSA 988]|nr:hypothetical protein H4R24_000401 [Coemansia sp. RSA 988]
MLPTIGALLSAAVYLTVSQLAKGLSEKPTRRDTSPNSLSDYRGALFVLASSQTSCEMALIDSGAGFVAASCLTFKSDGSVDNNVEYRVAIDSIGDEESTINSVTMVDVHPNYNSSTYANNIAVLHWGDSKRISWHQDIGQDRPSWDNTLYTRRTMSSVNDASWSTPSVLKLSGSDPVNGCSSASNLYNSNKDWFLCIAQTTKSIANSNCQTPYGMAWGAYESDSVAVAAIYSHSVIYDGNELCGNTGNQYHYYTMLQPYVDWSSEMTGRKTKTYASDSSYSYDGSSAFKMDNALAPAVSGVATVSGDQYPGAKEYEGSNNNTAMFPTDNSDDENTVDPDVTKDSGFSRGAIIAISTIVPIMTIAIIVGLFFIYKWWKRQKNVRNWDPKDEIDNIECIGIIDTIAGNGPTNNILDNGREGIQIRYPPAYVDHNFGAVSTYPGKAPA